MSSLTSFNTLTATSFQPFFVRKKFIFYCENVKYSYRFKGLTYMEIYIYIYVYWKNVHRIAFTNCRAPRTS